MSHVHSGSSFAAALLIGAAIGGRSVAQEFTAPPAIREAIVRDEARIRGDGSAFTAFQRRANLRARFDVRGVELRDLGERHGTLRLALRSFGRTDGVEAPPVTSPPMLDALGRVTFDHGALTEWWTSDSRGLEQGFTVPRAIAGEGRLRLGFALESEHALRVAPHGRTFDLVSAIEDGERESVAFRFERLVAFDRDGDVLPAEFVAVPGGVAIHVDDRGADYPLTIDPVASSPAFDLEGNFADAQLGISVASAGDVDGDGYSDLLVGASNFSGGLAFEGKAYLFPGGPSGLSTTAAWEAAGGQANAYFGRALASAGDLDDDGYSDVVIAAQLFDDDQTNEGRAFVYHGGASGLSLTPAIVLDGNEAEGQFGQALAGAGDVNGDGFSDLAVGSQSYDFGGISNSGLMSVFHGSASGVSATRTSIFGGTQFEERLGAAVASAGDVDADGFADLAYSSLLFDGTKTDEGKVFVHHGSASGLATSATFTALSGQVSAQMGAALGCAGDVNGDGYSDLVVGTPLFDFGNIDEGRAFLFTGSSSGLGANAAWTTESDQTNARHGNAVATAGDCDGDGFSDVAVAALLWDDTLTDLGRVSIYHGGASGLSTTAAQELLGTQSSGLFGQTLAFAGDVDGDGLSDLAVGAQAFANGQSGEGRVVVYHGTLSLPPTAFQWSAKGAQAGADFGRAAAFVGDLDGDGFDDVAFGAPEFDQTVNSRGKVAVHYGAASGLTPAAGFEAVGDVAGDRLGRAVARVGDFNGDGYDDVAFGAPGVDSDSPGVGEVVIYYGSVSGLSADAKESVLGVESFADFGTAIAGVGDVDGDGFVDLLVGAPVESATFTFGGAARLYRGGANGLIAGVAWEAFGTSASESFGSVVAGLGDIDRDGFSDFAVGAPNAVSDTGRVDVFQGSGSGPSAGADLSIPGTVSGEGFGVAIATAGDVDGDGFSDAAIGAENVVRIHHGSLTGLSATADTTLTGSAATGLFGLAVAPAGDLDRDGFDDLIVGAPLQFVDQVAEGAVYIYRGGASGLSSSVTWTAEGNQDSSEFGATLDGRGDVDGDGTGDLLICAPSGENGFTDEGRGFLYYGNGDGGVARGPHLRTLRSDQLAPVAHDAVSFAPTFRVDALVRSPFGRATLVPEIEVKAVGTAFDGVGLQSAAALDAGLSGVTNSVASASLADGQYRYRSRTRFETRMIPFQPATPWYVRARNGAQESDLTVTTATAVLVVAPTTALTVEHVIGDVDPAVDTVQVTNLGSGALGFTVSESPDVSWLTVSPAGGAGIVAGGVGTTVTFTYSTTTLTPGEYSTEVVIANAAAPSESVTIPVTLSVTNPRFTPGDRLEAVLDADDDVLDADFDAVAGETLKLRFDPVAAAFKLRVQVIDGDSIVVSNQTVKLQTAEIVKLNVKLAASGTYTLRLTSLTGTAGAALGIATTGKLPALAKQIVTNLSIKAGKTKTVKFLALDGAVLQFTLSGAVTGPLTITCDTPSGATLSFTELLQNPGDGTRKVLGVLLEETGEFALRITNGDSSKIAIGLDLEADQPLGGATVTLP